MMLVMNHMHYLNDVMAKDNGYCHLQHIIFLAGILTINDDDCLPTYTILMMLAIYL